MRYELDIGGRLRVVTIARLGGRFALSVDGREWVVDCARPDARTLSLLVSPATRAGDTGTGKVASYDVTIGRRATTGALDVQVGAATLVVAVNELGRRRDRVEGPGSGPQRVTAPMPGRIARVMVAPGEAVRARQPVVVVEAMKMENELRAVRDGTVREVNVEEGALVEAGALLIAIE